MSMFKASFLRIKFLYQDAIYAIYTTRCNEKRSIYSSFVDCLRIWYFVLRYCSVATCSLKDSLSVHPKRVIFLTTVSFYSQFQQAWSICLYVQNPHWRRPKIGHQDAPEWETRHAVHPDPPKRDQNWSFLLCFVHILTNFAFFIKKLMKIDKKLINKGTKAASWLPPSMEFTGVARGRSSSPPPLLEPGTTQAIFHRHEWPRSRIGADH